MSPGLCPSWEDTPLQAPYSRAAVRALWRGAREEEEGREGGGGEREEGEGVRNPWEEGDLFLYDCSGSLLLHVSFL